MDVRTLLSLSLILISNLSFSQSIWCNADSLVNAGKLNGKYDLFLQQVQTHEQKQGIETRTEKYFQVVVHIVRRVSTQEISDAQVIQQLDIINNDFADRGENIDKLLPEFQSLLTNTGIRFCLAHTDPEGNPTTGITHTITQFANIALQTGPQGRHAIHYDVLGGQNGWDPTRYINIWVGEYANILGSSSFPGMGGFPEEMGVVINITAFGALGEAAGNGFYSRGHTLTHELGHYFGLLHIWGDGPDDCEDTDDIDDTPSAANPYFDCPSGVQMSCGTSNMYQNFMDLTDDRCLAAFTMGQSTRMNSTIDIFYPDMAVEGTCLGVIEPFESWYDQLVWAYDQSSRQYVIYHKDGKAGDIHLEMFSIDGRFVLQDTWQSDQTYLLDLNLYANGIYLVRIYDGEHEEVRKVVTY